jgi:predicted site-specific integrase-resolvase
MSEIEHLKINWITTAEAAALVGASQQTIRNWYSTGKIKRRKKERVPGVGPRALFDEQEILDHNQKTLGS